MGKKNKCKKETKVMKDLKDLKDIEVIDAVEITSAKADVGGENPKTDDEKGGAV